MSKYYAIQLYFYFLAICYYNQQARRDIKLDNLSYITNLFITLKTNTINQ